MNFIPWLAMQCRMLPDVRRAIVAVGVSATDDSAQSSQIIAAYPNPSIETNDLLSAATLAVKRHCPVASSTQPHHHGANPLMVVAKPLSITTAQAAVLVVELPANDKQHAVIMQLLAWGQSWLQMLERQARHDSEINDVEDDHWSVLNAACQHIVLEQCAQAVATRIAELFACESVSVGIKQHHTMRLVAVSHSTRFNKKTALAEDFEQLLDECAAQQKPIDTSTDTASHCATHQHFTHRHQLSVYSLPLMHGGQCVGALCLLGVALRPSQQHQLIALANVLASLFEARRQAELSVAARWRDKITALFKGSVGQRVSVRQGWLAVAAVLLVVLFMGSGQHRVTAPASLEGRIQRAVVAPIDGYVLNAHVRAGDRVRAGQLIAELDDRELLLEYQRLQNQRDEFNNQYRKELAARNLAEARIVQAQAAQVQAELQLQSQRLERTRLTVPFDGVIIKGDLSHSLGAPVSKGQVLFEVAPLDEYRMVLHIDERDISYIKAGQRGQLYLNSQPSKALAFKVEQVASVYDQQADSVSFRTQAQLIDDDVFLRPGMQGVAKVDVGERRYSWILFHRSAQWLQLKLWSLLP